MLIALIPVVRSQTRKEMSPASTIQGKWYLRPVLGSDTVTGKIPEISFDTASGQFTGNTGCNNMRGNFHLSDSTLGIGEQIVTTKMICVGYNESAFLKNLIRVNRYRIRHGILILLVDGNEVSRWSRQIIKPSKILST